MEYIQEIIKLYGIPVAGEIQAEMAVKGSSLANTAIPLFCTVRLAIEFVETNGTTSTGQGTGFLVNLPDQYKRDLEVIMTAGHNLVSGNGEYARSIEVFFFNGPKITVLKEKNQYFASKSYERRPHIDNGVDDYGVIIISKDELGHIIGNYGGFGYSLLAPGNELVGKSATVYGYPLKQIYQPPIALNAVGPIVKVGGGRIEYELTTLPGHSGGPVCVEYNGSFPVVGIHNYGDNKKNIGTLLTCDVLIEILLHLEEKKSLELWVNKNKDKSGVFLKIPPVSGSNALARCGRDRYTNLSFVPVETYTMGDGPSPPTKYIICTPLVKPVMYLQFDHTESAGTVTCVRGEDLVDNRPTENNIVIMEFVSTGSNVFQISTFKTSEGQFLLRIKKDEFEKRKQHPSQDISNCSHGLISPVQGPNVELVIYSSSNPTKTTFTKFTVSTT